ncbi:MAG: hypothetical protein IPN94_13625 [Sphingobacteriales bacterium]|nr:hypothetical protein [Sphingobacteriales bacterium]
MPTKNQYLPHLPDLANYINLVIGRKKAPKAHMGTDMKTLFSTTLTLPNYSNSTMPIFKLLQAKHRGCPIKTMLETNYYRQNPDYTFYVRAINAAFLMPSLWSSLRL